ncbi:TetR/AcrR family transcriptional regulator [Paractinoplanes atraurantiacus]|uniref:TetR/AcrR family transcriptional regulator n=1 Tax=Paractinoplanes atraurantiacus TaxID=1036182 RepID=UPI001FE94BA2|nr:TetR/AcrR family transcriptional regulator [Actinoplanes atraurantiacus]
MTRYHHGDLRAALVEASFEVLAECGLQRFSVAAVARRIGVSTAAPYRHFPDRAHLLSAVSAAAARDLRTAIEAVVFETEEPGARMAAVAGAYVRYVGRTGAGMSVIFAAELYEVADDARRSETRALMTTLLDLASAAAGYPAATRLLEATLAVAHGYVSLFAEGFFALKDRPLDEIADRATEAALTLVD